MDRTIIPSSPGSAIELVCSVVCAQAGHPANAAAPIAAPDKLFRNVRLESICVVPNQISASLHQTAGPEKERSQNRTGDLIEDMLQNLQMIRIDVRRCKLSQTANV
jgi:hypothetical protein